MQALRKFLFEGLAVRGVHVRLESDWRDLLRRRSTANDAAPLFAPPVRRLLGEMSVASCLLQSNLKFDGALILQLHGDGPLKLAVAESHPDLRFRATAKVGGPIEDDATLGDLLDAHGRGRCVITLDPRGRQPGQQAYQGVVPLRDDQGTPLPDLAAALEHYMLKSEQLDTRLVLAADDEVAAGLLIQRLPLAGEGNLARGGAAGAEDDRIGGNEDYHRIALLTATLGHAELLALDAETLLSRLYGDERVRVFEPRAPRFACSCSRERVAAMLRGLGAAEVFAIVAERGEVEVGCDFCGAVQRFDRVDVDRLFRPERDQPPAAPGLQ